MKKPIIPDWFCVLRDDSLLNSRDVAAIFGYSCAIGLHNAIYHRRFPSPAKKIPSHKNRYAWTKKEIIAEINRRNTKCADRQKL